MNTIHLNIPLFDDEGKQVNDQTLAGTLSKMIGQETEGKSLKLYGWHKTLQVGDPLILDDSDLKDLEELIDRNKTFFVFVKGQILTAIQNRQKQKTR